MGGVYATATVLKKETDNWQAKHDAAAFNKGQRDELIKQQLKEAPELSDRRIAEPLGVDKNTVSVRRKELEGIGEIHQCSRQTSDGRTYPAQRKPAEQKLVSVWNPTPREERALQDDRVIER